MISKKRNIWFGCFCCCIVLQNKRIYLFNLTKKNLLLLFSRKRKCQLRIEIIYENEKPSTTLPSRYQFWNHESHKNSMIKTVDYRVCTSSSSNQISLIFFTVKTRFPKQKKPSSAYFAKTKMPTHKKKTISKKKERKIYIWCIIN